MTDNIESAYLRKLSAQQRSSNNAAADAFDAEFAEQPVTAAAPKPIQAPTAAPQESPSKLSGIAKAAGNYVHDKVTNKALIGGITEAAKNIWNTIDDAATWLDNNVMDLRAGSSTFGAVGGRTSTDQAAHQAKLQAELPQVIKDAGKGRSPITEVEKPLVQFAVPFGSAVKGLSLLSKQRGLNALAAGAATDFSAFDPHQERLSNAVEEAVKIHPELANPVTKYLASSPNDSNMEGRLKNSVEGLGLGLVGEGIIRSVRLLKSIKTVRGESSVEGKLAQADSTDTAKAKEVAKAAEPEKSLTEQLSLVKELDGSGRRPMAPNAGPHVPPEVAAERILSKGKQDLKVVPKQGEEGIPYRPDAKEPVAPDWALVEKQAAENPIKVQSADGAEKAIDEVFGPVLAKQGPLTDEERSILSAYRDLQKEAIKDHGFKSSAPVPKSGPKVGDTVFYGNGENSGEVIGLSKNGKVIIKDDATGAKKTVTPDPEDALMAEVRANNDALAGAGGKQQQGGFVSANVLSHLAGGSVGGATGYATADPNASLADKLTRAGVGALMGVGGVAAIKAGAHRILSPSEAHTVENIDPAVVSLSRKEVAGISPIVPTKALPSISKEGVDKLVTSLKDGKMGELASELEKSDFNFAHIDTEQDVKDFIDGTSKVFAKEIDRAKHGVQSFEQIKALAEETNSTPEALMKLYEGTDNIGARILSHRTLLAASAEKVLSLSKLAMTGDIDAVLALRKQVDLHSAFQAQLKGVQTEVARAFGQYRIKATTVGMSIEERNLLVDAMGGLEANQEFAKRLSEITDPAKLAKVLEKSATARTADALYEAWRAGLLSSPTTHAANFTGNLLVALFSPAERMGASLVGTVLRNPEAIRAGEVKAQLYGMVRGAMDSLRIGADGFNTLRNAAGEIAKGDYHASLAAIRAGDDTLPETMRALFHDDAGPAGVYGGLTGKATEHVPAISAAAFNLDPATMWGKGADLLGAAIRIPYRALSASDALFQTLHFSGELHAQAYRIASREGLEGAELANRVAALAESPTEEMLKAARQAAAEGTFQQPLGKKGQALQNLLHYSDGSTRGAIMSLPGRFLVPFVKTPTNILKYWGKHTPVVNLLSREFREAWQEGGVKRDMAVARLGLGSTLYAVAGTLASMGLITGGGEKDRTAESVGGWQPYSFKIGDKYYAYNRSDPVGMFFGIAADLADMWGHNGADHDNLAAMALLSASRNLTSKTWLMGVSDIIDVMAGGDEKKATRLIQKFASSGVPYSGLVRSIRKEDDDLQREVWSVMDAWKNTIPGYSKDLPPHVNLLGEDVKVKGGLGPDILSPWAESTENPSPAAREVARLNIDMKHPPRAIPGTHGAPPIDLTPQQYYRWMKLMGNELKDSSGKGFADTLNELVQSDAYKALPEDPTGSLYVDAKEKTIKLLHEKYKAASTKKLISEFPDLEEKFKLNLQNEAAAMSGRPIFQIPKQ